MCRACARHMQRADCRDACNIFSHGTQPLCTDVTLSSLASLENGNTSTENVVRLRGDIKKNHVTFNKYTAAFILLHRMAPHSLAALVPQSRNVMYKSIHTCCSVPRIASIPRSLYNATVQPVLPRGNSVTKLTQQSLNCT